MGLAAARAARRRWLWLSAWQRLLQNRCRNREELNSAPPVVELGPAPDPGPSVPPDTTAKPMIVLHVATAVLAYCVLGAQALNSLAYLLQHRALARRRFGGIYAFLPALVPLERVGAQLLGAAVWMLGLSLVIGAVDWSANLSLVTLPKLGAASAAWLGALFVAVQRRRERLLGPAFARASLWLLLPALLALWLSLPAARA